MFDQGGFRVRMGWGCELAALTSDRPVVVVVDVLRFTTCVSVAGSRGAAILPFRWHDDRASAYAAEHGAELAGPREDGGWSLSPTDLARLPAGARVVLPSPNGATLALEAASRSDAVYAGCLRNAATVAAAIGSGPVAVIAAGEDGGRPAVEDLIGAGAVISHLGGTSVSPEAEAAAAAFRAAPSDVGAWLLQCGSGRELVERGWTDDVLCAARIDIDRVAPRLVGPAFVA